MPKTCRILSLQQTLFCLFFLTFSAPTQSQLNKGLSYFALDETGTEPIGFTSMDCSFRLKKTLGYSLYGGMRINGAITGQRGGFFTFGYLLEHHLFDSSPIKLGINNAFTAGGGAGAPDYDGWMVQNALFLIGELNHGFSLRAGINHAYVSRGFIKGFSPMFGLNWNGVAVAREENTVFSWTSVYGEAGGGRYDGQFLQLIGAGAHYKIGQYIGGDLVTHALFNTFGGYMQFLYSLGPELSSNRISFLPAPIIGMGGGGGVPTGGGALYGAQFGIHYQGPSFYANVKAQALECFSDDYHFRGAFIGLGKTLTQENKLTWYPIAKAYIGDGGFGNIGMRIKAFGNDFFEFMGATYWAFTDNRGAYAEGIFEVLAKPTANFPVYAVFSGGAGAGAGVNLKTASTIASAGLGFYPKWKKFPLGIETAYQLAGNLPNWSVSLYFRPQ